MERFRRVAVSIKKKKIEYIDGIKGVACMMVMLGHYYCIYSLAEEFIPMPALLEGVFRLVEFFLDADLGLFIFALLSGYCVALSKIDTVKKLLGAIFKRFIRFLIPVLGANVITYLIYLSIGFHNGATTELFVNMWFWSYYQNDMWLGLAVKDSVKTILGNGAVFNASFWVIRYFFYASMIVYVGSYLESKCTDKIKYVLYVLELVAATYLFQTNGFAIALGAVWCKIERTDLLSRWNNKKVLGVLAAVAFVLLDGGAEWLAALLGINVITTAWAKILYAFIILYAISRVEILTRLFSKKVFVDLSKLSFGIYALHWPIICSISSLLFLQVEFSVGAYLLIGAGTAGLVLVAALLYHLTVEKCCDVVLKVVNERVLNG